MGADERLAETDTRGVGGVWDVHDYSLDGSLRASQAELTAAVDGGLGVLRRDCSHVIAGKRVFGDRNRELQRGLLTRRQGDWSSGDRDPGARPIFAVARGPVHQRLVSVGVDDPRIR